MPGPAPKHRDARQNRIQRPEIGIVPAQHAAQIIPTPPKGLLKQTQQRWEVFWTSPLAQAVDVRTDGYRIERWIRAVDELERVYPVFRKQRVVHGSTGQPRLNPLATYITDLHAELSKAETDLGLTPLARLKLGIVYGEAAMTAADLNRALDDDD